MLQSTRRREGSREGWQGWQQEQRDDLTLSEALHVLWERRMLVVGCTVFFLALALFYSLWKEPVYTAEATLSLRSEEGIGSAGNLDQISSSLQDSAGPGLVEEAADRAGWERGQADFNRRLDPERVNDEEIKVRFSAPTPEEAARGANAYAEVFVERVGELKKSRLAGGTVPVHAEVEKAAEPPEGRSDWKVFLAVIAAGVGGFLVGGIGALFLEGRAHRWSGSKDAERTLRAPVLGVIPDYSVDLPDGSLSRDDKGVR